jgi:RimJ/RimL family protein N-acetyltransferase
MNLLPLDRPELIELAANWLGREENYKWLDFGEGVRALSVVSLRIMTQRDLHLLRLFTPDESDLPIGLVALSDVRRQSKTAGSVWAVLGRKRHAGYARRAVSKLLTLGFGELGLEAVSAWTVECNVAARRVLEQLNFRYVGRQRRRHWIDGRPYDRLLYDLLATEHHEVPVSSHAPGGIRTHDLRLRRQVPLATVNAHERRLSTERSPTSGLR